MPNLTNDAFPACHLGIVTAVARGLWRDCEPEPSLGRRDVATLVKMVKLC